jgi:ABC-type lipoprotein export system ATPase subunit
MISLRSIAKSYPVTNGSAPVLRDIDVDISGGELVAIIGPSGSGKTTLMNIMGCLDQPTSGSYFFEGIDVSTLSDRELSRIRNEKIGFVFQMFHLLPHLSVRQNVLLPLLYTAHYPDDAGARADELLDLVGLSARRNYFPGQLSGGQQQRVSIARALINRPRVVLADEPTGNLDSESGASILALFRELNALGHTIIIVTHSDATAAIARRTIEIVDGRIRGDAARSAS